MDVSLFDYHLPAERIAQTPISRRDQAKLLVVDRATETWCDEYIFRLPELLTPGDLLIFNDSKVFKARLHVKDAAGRVFELFLLRPNGEHWEALLHQAKKIHEGEALTLPDGTAVHLIEKQTDGTVLVKFSCSTDEVFSLCDKFGEVPTPPYVKQTLQDSDRYQTIYAKEIGSVAAPTAGLHFTPDLFEKLEKRGVKKAFVTLHVGLGTFRPIKTETLEEHEMHSEWANVPQETIDLIQETKKNGHRVIAVGTTATRALESMAQGTDMSEGTGGHSEGTGGHVGPPLRPFSGFTNIFITPGYQFRVIDGLLTNFHLPKSTLLVLISAFAGREFMLRAYEHAIEEKYRFYSFGDAMLIV